MDRLREHALRFTIALTFAMVSVFMVTVQAQPVILSCTTNGYSPGNDGLKQQGHRFIFDSENKTFTGGEHSPHEECEHVEITEDAIRATCSIIELHDNKTGNVFYHSDNSVRIDRLNLNIQITYYFNDHNDRKVLGKASGACQKLKQKI